MESYGRIKRLSYIEMWMDEDGAELEHGHGLN